jgi:hypothetical protein
MPPFSRFVADVRREFMQRLFYVLHGTLGSYLRDVLHEGRVTVVACLRAPWAFGFFDSRLVPCLAGGFHCFLCNK